MRAGLLRCSMLLSRFSSSLSGGGNGSSRLMMCSSGGGGGGSGGDRARFATTTQARLGVASAAAAAAAAAASTGMLPLPSALRLRLPSPALLVVAARAAPCHDARMHAVAARRHVTAAAVAAQPSAARGGGGDGSPPASLPQTAVGRVVAAEANFVRVDVHRLGPLAAAGAPPPTAAAELAAAAAALQQHEQQQQDQEQQRQDQEQEQEQGQQQQEQLQPQQERPQPPRRQLLCTMRALLKKLRQRALVGDVVTVAGIDWAEGRGVVDGVVLPRAAELKDPSVANVDRAVLVFGLASPPFEPVQVSRFLVAAEAAGLPVTLALNKADLAAPGEAAARVRQCAEWGYAAVPISCATGEGLAGLKAALAGATAVVAGPSGAGKSSLINALRMGRHREDEDGEGEGEAQLAAYGDGGGSEGEDEDYNCSGGSGGGGTWEEGEGEEDGEEGGGEGEGADDGDEGGRAAAPRASAGYGGYSGGPNRDRAPKDGGFLAVGNVSARTGRGRHTTRVVRLLPLPGGGMVADTPGFSLPTLDGVGSAQLKYLFPEFLAAVAAAPEGRCRFHNCMHVAEPGCAVLAAGLERHAHYLKFLDDVAAREDYERNVLGAGKRAREGAVKVKTGRGGARRAEARLEAKRHRVTSRRAGKQGLLRAVDEASGDVGDDDASR